MHEVIVILYYEYCVCLYYFAFWQEVNPLDPQQTQCLLKKFTESPGHSSNRGYGVCRYTSDL